MKNEFRHVMTERTDDELIQIITVDKTKYKEQALKAAKQELETRNISPEYFDQYKTKLNNEKKEVDETEQLKAGKIRRAINFVVDSTIVFGLIYIYNVYVVGGKSELPIRFMLSLFFGYYIILEYRFGQTIGKFITNTKVTDTTGKKTTISQITARTCCRFIPFDPLTFFFNREGMKFHDTLTKTTVIVK